MSGDHDAVAVWDYDTSNDVSYHKVSRQIQIEFDENDKPYGNGIANWGNFYYATDAVDDLTAQSGADFAVRSAFAQNGKLDGSKDTNFRAVQDNWPVFGFASDFGDVGSSPVSSLFTLGLMQQNAVQFLGADGVVSLPSLWGDYFGGDDLEAVR